MLIIMERIVKIFPFNSIFCLIFDREIIAIMIEEIASIGNTKIKYMELFPKNVEISKIDEKSEIINATIASVFFIILHCFLSF